MLFLLCNQLSFSMMTYDLNLIDYSEKHFQLLNELIGTEISSVDARIYEYQNLREFTQTTGAPFFICAFTNKEGIHIQSRYLLGEKFEQTLIHELLHFTIKEQYPVPAWFEEGVVCLVTQEFSNVTDIIPMKNVENFDIRKASNNWELVSYCLGCQKAVSELLSLKPAEIGIP